MVAIVEPGTVLGAQNPLLDTFTADAGKLADPAALSFQLFDIRDDTVAPVQVWPAQAGQRQAVDLVADRVGLGHFAAAWTVPQNATVGRYQVRWYLTQNAGDAERSWRRDFEVLPQVFDPAARLYATIADVRAEGVAASVGNRRIFDALARASERIETWTGRCFEPVPKALKIDGYTTEFVLLDEPLCALESMGWAEDGSAIDPGSIVVYNRHLTAGMLRPDDRDSPKIQFVRYGPRGILADVFPTYPLIGGYSDLRAPRTSRAQEIQVIGVFGYTDPERNGCPVGVTPADIRRAAVLIALRDLPKEASQADQAFDASYGHRIKAQQTREQRIEWNPRLASDQIAPFTGDPKIDGILLTYMRPLSGGGV